jgi:hypothetical protein
LFGPGIARFSPGLVRRCDKKRTTMRDSTPLPETRKRKIHPLPWDSESAFPAYSLAFHRLEFSIWCISMRVALAGLSRHSQIPQHRVGVQTDTPRWLNSVSEKGAKRRKEKIERSMPKGGEEERPGISSRTQSCKSKCSFGLANKTSHLLGGAPNSLTLSLPCRHRKNNPVSFLPRPA